MLLLLKLPPSSPPTNALKEHPEIARMIALYSACKNMACLPEPGAWLDQPYDVTVYFSAFGAAEAEHMYNIQQG